MKVADLMRELEKLPGDAPVLVGASDHSYREGDFYAGTARYIRRENYYCEEWDDVELEPGEQVIAALIEG